MSHTFLFSPEFLSALAGAAVAAGATLYAQNRSFAHERELRGVERRALERKEADRILQATSVLAFSVLTKINYAFTNIADIHNHLHDTRMRTIRERMTFAAAFQPFSTDPKKIDFSLDELVLIRSLKNAELLGHVMDLPNIQSMYIDHMDIFRSIKDEINRLADISEVNSGGSATLMLRGSAAGRGALLMRQIDTLAAHLLKRSWDDVCRTNNMMFDLQKKFSDRLGKETLEVSFELVRMREAPPVERKRRGVGTQSAKG